MTESKAQMALDATLQVLKEAGKPLSQGDILRRAVESGLLKGTAKEWENTLAAKLHYEISKNSTGSKIYKPETGRFALKSLSAEATSSTNITSNTDEISRLKEEIRNLKEENAALKALVKRYI